MNALRRFGRWTIQRRLYRADGWDLQRLVAFSMAAGGVIGVLSQAHCESDCLEASSVFWTMLLFIPVLTVTILFQFAIIWVWKLLSRVESYPTSRAVEETLKEMEKEAKNGQLGTDQCTSGCDLCQHRE